MGSSERGGGFVLGTLIATCAAARTRIMVLWSYRFSMVAQLHGAGGGEVHRRVDEGGEVQPILAHDDICLK